MIQSNTRMWRKPKMSTVHEPVIHRRMLRPPSLHSTSRRIAGACRALPSKGPPKSTRSFHAGADLQLPHMTLDLQDSDRGRKDHINIRIVQTNHGFWNPSCVGL